MLSAQKSVNSPGIATLTRSVLINVPAIDLSSYQSFTPETVPVQLITIVLGLVLIIAGRRLFWLFVAALGFLTATDLVTPLIDPEQREVLLGVGLIAGLAGAVLAIFIQKFAVGLAGALAGGYYLHLFFQAAALQHLWWVGILAGAILGALLMHFLFRWALVIFSSIAGAHLIATTFPLSTELATAIFLVLAIIGLLIQARQMRSN